MRNQIYVEAANLVQETPSQKMSRKPQCPFLNLRLFKSIQVSQHVKVIILYLLPTSHLLRFQIVSQSALQIGASFEITTMLSTHPSQQLSQPIHMFH